MNAVVATQRIHLVQVGLLETYELLHWGVEAEQEWMLERVLERVLVRVLVVSVLGACFGGLVIQDFPGMYFFHDIHL